MTRAATATLAALTLAAAGLLGWALVLRAGRVRGVVLGPHGPAAGARVIAYRRPSASDAGAGSPAQICSGVFPEARHRSLGRRFPPAEEELKVSPQVLLPSGEVERSLVPRYGPLTIQAEQYEQGDWLGTFAPWGGDPFAREGEAAPLAQAVAGPDGRFTLEGLGGGPVTLWVERADLGATWREVSAPAEASLTLGQGALLEGWVGAPEPGWFDFLTSQANAEVVLAAEGQPRCLLTRAGPTGRYSFGRLPPGRYLILARTPDHAYAAVGRRLELPLLHGGDLVLGSSDDPEPPLSPQPPEPKPTPVAAGKAVQVRGRALDEQGRPLAWAPVRLWEPKEIWESRRHPSRLHRVSLAATADETGRFTFPAVPPGDYAIAAFEPRPDRVDQETWFPLGRRVGRALPVDEAPPPEVELRLEPGLTLSGRVLDVRGNPVAGALVTGQAEAAQVSPTPDLKQLLDGSIPTQTFSGDDGRFQLTGLAAATYHLSARRKGYLTWGPERGVEARPGGAPALLELERPSTLVGRVLDPVGAPVGHFYVKGDLSPASFPSINQLNSIFSGVPLDPGQDFTAGSYRYDLPSSQQVSESGARLWVGANGWTEVELSLPRARLGGGEVVVPDVVLEPARNVECQVWDAREREYLHPQWLTASDGKHTWHSEEKGIRGSTGWTDESLHFYRLPRRPMTITAEIPGHAPVRTRIDALAEYCSIVVR